MHASISCVVSRLSTHVGLRRRMKIHFTYLSFATLLKFDLSSSPLLNFFLQISDSGNVCFTVWKILHQELGDIIAVSTWIDIESNDFHNRCFHRRLYEECNNWTSQSLFAQEDIRTALNAIITTAIGNMDENRCTTISEANSLGYIMEK